MTTSYKSIRKEGKARWVYECPTCGITRRAADLFRIVEAKQRHMRSSAHVFKAMEQAFQPIVEAYGEFARAAMAAMEPFMALAATPMNRPHDPTLLGDKRKWGGR
jgi:hypothetical protein